MVPYDDIDLGQHWLCQWLGVTKPFITWTNVDWSSVKSCSIHLRAISQEMLKISILHIDSLVQDCSNSSVLAMELLQFCTKPSYKFKNDQSQGPMS